MCGIFGYVGSQDAVALGLEGLRRLEYRGYDSAGIAGGRNGELVVSRVPGKVVALEAKVCSEEMAVDYAIAHTRWATHGAANEANAHPHCDQDRQLALVHNGIIENYAHLKEQLEAEGVRFLSETDSEVVAGLIAKYYDGDLLKAVQLAVPLLQGSFAVAVIHKDFPEEIVVAANESPLLIGVGDDEAFVGSDIHAFLTHTRRVIYLSDHEVARVTRDKIDVYDASAEQVMKQSESVSLELITASKGEYEHFTIKEIYEQPQAIRNALLSRYVIDSGTAVFEEIDEELLLGVERILIVGCGTSWHAGLVGSYLFEELARIPTQVEIASELRYKNPIVAEGTLAIAISQSGETADTLAAIRELKEKGATILSLCNVHGSTLARESHGTIFLRSGAEIGVCSTKAFTSQLVVLALITLSLARQRHMSLQDGLSLIDALRRLPDRIEELLQEAPAIEAIAKKYCHYDDFFYLGRRYMYPLALEGALKIKEIAYINANGYPAGEMKHGPIALISDDCPTVAFCTNRMTYDKILSNLEEVKARYGRVVAIAFRDAARIAEVADEVVYVPETVDALAAIPAAVVAQLFAYYVACQRGTEIDQPRNLAKSVSVE